MRRLKKHAWLRAIPDADLHDLKARLGRVRWGRPDPAGDWSRGIPADYLKGLADYWRDRFDWRAQEERLNRLPQFTTEIDGQTFHFAHLKSGHPEAVPLLLCHGWPGSFIEFDRVIDELAYPKDPVDAFDLVVPSLPGFGFSVPLAGPGWDLPRTTRAYATIMDRLGYQRYGVHGSDIGSGIAGHLASFYPERVIGTHVASDRSALNYVGVFLPLPPDLSNFEKAELDSIKAAGRDGDGYFRQQSSKPQTLAYGLGDSPVGQLAWIAEKFAEWTDPKKPLPDEAVDRDQLLANISLYWFTNSAGSSAQWYWETSHSSAGWTAPSEVPVGWAVFNTHNLVRRIMDPQHKIGHWSEFESGGHFPAMEQPELLAGDIQKFFRGLR